MWYVVFLLVVCSGMVLGQEEPGEKPANGTPVSTQWLLGSASPTQHAAINSVYLLVCPRADKKGTSFLFKSGIMATDNHVVEGCNSADLWAMSPMGEKITFSKLVTDTNRDLALLRPTSHLEGGFDLGSDVSHQLETRVTTWGFPLIYNGPAPILSVGYVAGYDDAPVGKAFVKHPVVNEAFNPGNSGGPLLVAPDNKVVGVVVWKMRLLPHWVQTASRSWNHAGSSCDEFEP
jgi:S1-C subfamily serine protease